MPDKLVAILFYYLKKKIGWEENPKKKEKYCRSQSGQMNITIRKVVDNVVKNYNPFFINIGTDRDILVQI